MSWRTGGIGPEKTSAGLRGAGLIAVVIAFLAVSNGYVSGGDDEAKDGRTTPAGRPVVVAAEGLRPLLTRVAPAATYRFVPTAAVRRAIEDNDRADVAITDQARDAQALVTQRRCVQPVPLARRGTTIVVACLPSDVAADAALGRGYLAALTSLRGRATIVDAGYDVPAR